MDVFWAFLMFMALQPILKQKMLEASRQKLLRRIELMRESRVVLLVHRQESMGFLGFPMMKFIDINDSEEVLRAIHLTAPEVPIDLILHTPGGLVLASLQIARAILRHPGKVTVFVPHYAMSGGTLIALAADEIVMSEHAVLGPVDPQLGQLPAVSVLRAVERKSIDEVDDQTLIMADQAEKAIRQLHAAVKELLAPKLPEAKCEEIARLLSEGHWTHDYPITPHEAKEIGLPVSTEMPEEVMNLLGLYPQPVRHQPTVEYLPIPRTPPRSAGKNSSRS